MSDARDQGEPRGRFPKSARVRKRREYREIQAHGRRVSLRSFVLIISSSLASGSNQARIGITASRKVGNSVVRSRVRRLVREAFRAARDLFPAGIDVVVIVKNAPPHFGLWDVLGEWRAAEPQLKKRISEVQSAARARSTAGRSQQC